jgi:hypothetical protein
VHDGWVVAVAGQQAVISEARWLRDEEHLSLRAIAARLEEKGHHSPTGKHWGLATIARMVDPKG